MNYQIAEEGSTSIIMYMFTIENWLRPLIGDVINIPGYFGKWKITRSIPSGDPSTSMVTLIVEPMSDLGPQFHYTDFDAYYARLHKKGGDDLYLLRPKDLGDPFVY